MRICQEKNLPLTRMHSSRMCTARSLTVSRRILCMPPRQKPHMPPGKNHACPPRRNHAHPPAKTTHAPGSNHVHPPGATMHAPLSNHACPPSPPEQPRMPPPGATTHAPPVNRITDACENITFANYVCGR